MNVQTLCKRRSGLRGCSDDQMRGTACRICSVAYWNAIDDCWHPSERRINIYSIAGKPPASPALPAVAEQPLLGLPAYCQPFEPERTVCNTSAWPVGAMAVNKRHRRLPPRRRCCNRQPALLPSPQLWPARGTKASVHSTATMWRRWPATRPGNRRPTPARQPPASCRRLASWVPLPAPTSSLISLHGPL